MMPKVFAIYRREEETFQFIQSETNEKGEVQRLKGWCPPTQASADAADATNTYWDLGSEWYIEPTDYKGASPVLYNCIVHDKAYKWWSSHHKLVWSNYKIYESRNSSLDWHHCHSIPVLEFNNKHIYPREYIPVEARWASTTPQDLEAELAAARKAYVAHEASQHVDPSELRIQTPKEKASIIHKRRAVSPMPSDESGNSDIHEWETEFTPSAPKAKHIRVGKHLDYMYDSEDDLNNSWSPCVALALLGACLLGTWSLIGMHVLGY
jgi:hypothetical protein